MTAPKRFFDLTVALALLAPAIAICALVLPLIAWECRAAPLFLQWRVGKGGRPFRIVKLRTMHPATPQLGSHLVGSDAITRTGRFLRKVKIDELPQLLNVLNGSMSLVGPRPCLPSQTELIAERQKHGVDRLTPGITGPAQVAGWDMSDPVRLAQADSAYLQRWRLRRDLELLAKTFLGRGRGDAARR